jgi:hypothetical protein
MVIVQFANGKYAVKTDNWPSWASFNFYERDSTTVWSGVNNIHHYCTYNSAQEAAEFLEELKAVKREHELKKKYKVIK